MSTLTRRRLLAGGGALALGATAYTLLRGFEDAPGEVERIPPALRGAALDVHVHVLGGSGCWLHEAMRSSFNARAGLWNLRLHFGQPDLDQAYVRYLLDRMARAGFLKQVVLLAHDWTHDTAGERDRRHTPFYTPNRYVARLAREHRECLFGASIHPYRPDALDELDRAAEEGAVLVKWIPNVQAIDLHDARCRAFYRRLAEHRIALLAHAGDEQALFVAGQHYGDPRSLVAPLEHGVTVIAAHVGTLGVRDGRTNFDWLAGMLGRWPNLYADTSALTLVTRWRSLLRLAERTDLHQRLIHGSDFPLPPAATMFAGRIRWSRWWDAWKRENAFRRDFEIKQALGLPAAIYTRGYEVLAPRLTRASRPDHGPSDTSGSSAVVSQGR
jgi:predicted TIM-barrel fold metal-dependent hydrolase